VLAIIIPRPHSVKNAIHRKWSVEVANVEKTTVKGGWLIRDAKTGVIRSVGSGDKVCKSSAASSSAVKEVSNRRSAALKRLADR
jgi:hypothetical protein